MTTNKHELAKIIQNEAEKSGIYWTLPESKQMIELFLTGVKESIEKGEDVRLIGFGTFDIRERAERMGRNPQTGEAITIPATKIVGFKPGKELKELVKPKVKAKPKGKSKAKPKAKAKK